MSNLWQNFVRQIYLEQAHAYSYWWDDNVIYDRTLIYHRTLFHALFRVSNTNFYWFLCSQVKNPIPAGSAVGGSGPITTSWATRRNVRTDTRGQSVASTCPPSPRTVPVSTCHLCLLRCLTSSTDSLLRHVCSFLHVSNKYVDYTCRMTWSKPSQLQTAIFSIYQNNFEEPKSFSFFWDNF